MILRLRCVCRHGYGTHALEPIGATVQPFACRAKGCPCIVYTRAVK